MRKIFAVMLMLLTCISCISGCRIGASSSSGGNDTSSTGMSDNDILPDIRITWISVTDKKIQFSILNSSDEGLIYDRSYYVKKETDGVYKDLFTVDSTAGRTFLLPANTLLTMEVPLDETLDLGVYRFCFKFLASEGTDGITVEKDFEMISSSDMAEQEYEATNMYDHMINYCDVPVPGVKIENITVSEESISFSLVNDSDRQIGFWSFSIYILQNDSWTFFRPSRDYVVEDILTDLGSGITRDMTYENFFEFVAGRYLLCYAIAIDGVIYFASAEFDIDTD